MNLTYTTFYIKKTKHKRRKLCEPNKELKEFQKNILDKMYEVKPHDCNHGFYPGRSIVTNALKHEGKKYVMSLDIKNYFDNTTTQKVEKILTRFYPDYVKYLPRFIYKNSLPQGAPTSPWLANFALWDFDQKVTEYCEKNSIDYTRYADDLTFSWNDRIHIKRFLKFLNQELLKENYVFAKNKTKLMPKNKQQKVTGLVVNVKVNVPKRKRNLIRAYNHISNSGNWNPKDTQYLAGNNGFLQMINPKNF